MYFLFHLLMITKKGLTLLYQSYLLKLVTRTGFEPMNVSLKGI